MIPQSLMRESKSATQYKNLKCQTKTSSIIIYKIKCKDRESF